MHPTKQKILKKINDWMVLEMQVWLPATMHPMHTMHADGKK
jgi:hypothetical protein